MKRYCINPSEKQFSWGNMSIVSLGEKGRGRKEAYIPYHAKEDFPSLEIGKTQNGNPKIVDSQSTQDWLARINCEGCYTRNTYGTAYVPARMQDNVKVVAYGYGAYGAAGRVGDWYDFLCIVKDGTLIKVRPSGGSHKIERYWLYFGPEKVDRVEKIEMDMFCEQAGLERPPEEFGDLIDLASLT